MRSDTREDPDLHGHALAGQARFRWTRWPQAALFALALAFASVMAAPRAQAATILYVDQSNTSCSDTGQGSASVPFCTINGAIAKVTAGQTVQVASGTYRELVRLTKSGTSAAPITIEPAPSAAVTVTGGTNGFRLDRTSWVFVHGFSVTGTTGPGIYVYYGSQVTISENHVTYSGKPVSGSTAAGIYVGGTTDSLIAGNTTDHNTDAGIYLTNAATRVEVSGNTSFANARGYARAAPGIDVRASGNTVDRNITYGNEDTGVQVYNGAANTVVLDNLSYGNGDHGIDVLNSPSAVIVGNTVYNSKTAGINVEGSSSGATVMNNISVGNGLTSTSTRGNIRVDANSTSGTTLDYDLLYLSSPGTVITWGSTQYTSLVSFVSATGKESHGLQGDPQWSSPAAGNFRLTAGSPAIDSAQSAAPAQTATDIEGLPRTDDPATVNTGAGPRTYDDRGAYEYQPGTPADAAPAARLSVSPASGTAPLAVTADASASTDTDATPIASYNFNFGDGTTTGTQPAATANHTYTTAGTYTVTVTVTDTAGLNSTATGQVAVSTASQNLVGNPGFETNTSGWNTSGRTGVTLTRVAGGHSGDWSARLYNGGTSAIECTLNDSPNWVTTTVPGTYTIALWVRSDTPGATLTLKLREYRSSTQVGSKSATITLSTAWQQISLTYTPAAAGASSLDFNAYISNAQPGTGFYADDASITVG
jgi:parallel beta-helix repeat protein